MANVIIDRPEIASYPTTLEFRAYITDLDPQQYVDFFWSVSHPEIIEEVIHTNYTGKYVFKIFNDANMTVTVNAVVYKYDMAFQKITDEIITRSVELYPSVLTERHRFGLPPRPSNYDTDYEYVNTLTMADLDFTVWQPIDEVFELPYYYPVIAKVVGGLPPYTYDWSIDPMGSETIPPHDIFFKDNICSLVFPLPGMYHLNVKVTDSRGVSVEKQVEIRALPKQAITSYKFDVKPRAPLYDGTFITMATWSPPKDILSRNNNYYVGKYKMKIDLTGKDITMSDVLSQLHNVVNKATSPQQMWERYYASKGFSFYAMSSRAGVYYPGRTTIQNLYVDDAGYIGFNLRLTSDYPISSAIARILQAFRWVVAMNDIPYTYRDINYQYEFKPTAHSDEVLDGMLAYITDLVKTKYARVELDERFEAIQTDVEVFLGKEHRYENNGTVGYPFID